MSVNYEKNCYPGIVNNDETCFRFTDKEIQSQERLLFNNSWREVINQFGIKTKYFVNTYNVLSADNLYGEQTTKTFSPPIEFVMAINLSDNSITLSKFGFLSEDEITAYIHISSFKDTFFQTLSDVWGNQYDVVEPKAGDVFQLSEFGNDRPSNRQAKYFEVTERLDEVIAEINPLAGHYVFMVKAKRFDYSFEPNIPFNTVNSGISGNQQIYEDSFSGRLSGGTNDQTEPKKDLYDEYSSTSFSKLSVFDMSQNDTDVYGDYY